MGLNARLARYAAAGPRRPFVVAVPGGTRVRMLVEGELRRRGWFQADAPTAADPLIVCGDPGTELAEAIDRVWAEMPGPRARVALPSETVVVREALDGAVAELADLAVQREHARSRTAGPRQPDDEGNHGHDEHGSHGAHDGHGEHGEHGEHGHHMMGAPAGVAMARRAPDRDGLKLDVLHVPLGPVLRDWPAGLKVMLTLQGDVVQAAEVHALPGADAERFWDEPWLAAQAGDTVTRGAAERRRAASHLDSLARFLGVAGWRDQAARASVLRDDVIAGDEIAQRFERFARRTERSPLLHWMTRGLGAIDQGMVTRFGLTGPAARRPGDVPERVAGWLAEIRESLDGMSDPAPLEDDEGPRGPVGRERERERDRERQREPSAALLGVLPSLLVGAELAAARLIVASLDPLAVSADG